ncbi:efflux RND transporter permease subunit [Psychrosphaera sp. 1_MG-2023]|uniref:efflux RND transporter permease subunit n=1 Tax=Psychrosphaera sp. 1_MG-2023 TaxID=3062643 RepID=UPI0026E415B2|nr:efflux RND transporter permease subunit [Psychrosphaera sp. 1_MG-2023]MDO6719045.1 efflux RND transporter permease subunit [Psychrosphaera sp. 1_MG-2023]
MDIARYSIKNPVNIWLMVIVFIIGGLIALNNIGRLEDPAFTIKQVQVVTQFPGASAVKVEREITEPLEIAIQQMPQLRRIMSISKPGVSEITVEVESHYDSNVLPQIWDELRKRLRDAGKNLPIGAQTPSVYDDFGDVYGMYYALSAPEFSPQELREFARIIRRELLVTEGVAKVQVSGVQQEQLVAYINPYQIAGLGISFPDLAQLLAENLKPFNGGRAQVGEKKVRILVDNALDKIDEIYNLSLVVPGSSRSIKIRDVAELKIEPVDIQPVLVRYQGHEAITLAISALNDVNIVNVGHSVTDKVEQIITTLPAGITLTPIYDQAALVDQSVKGFIDNLILSVVVVTLTLCIFMGWRSGVVVGAVLLVTVMGTVLIMWLMGLQLQRISLGAMVIAMGMLVDNAIVVAEGMMLRMKQGKSATEAASFIVKRTQWPLLGATIIGIAAFSGIGLSDDATGEFLYSLFAVVLVSLLLSWVLATTVVPLFGKYFYQVGNDTAGETNKGVLYRGYLALLHTALKFRWITVAALLAITVVAYMGFGSVKQGFFPSSNAPLFYIHYWGPQDRDIRHTTEIMTQAESAILEHKDVDTVTTFIGRGADRFTLTYAPQQPNESYGYFLIKATDRDKIDSLIKTLVKQLPQLDLDANFYSERMQFGPGGGAKLAARFSGPDTEVLRDLAEQAKTILINDEKVRDIRHNWREKGLAINTHYDAFNAGMTGITRSDFSQAIQYASTGLELGKLQDGDYSYSIKAKMAMASDSELDSIKNSQVWSSSQRHHVPFLQVSNGLELVNEETQIHRRNRLRTITVNADPGFDETAGQAFARMKPQIEAISLPDGYKLEWGGEYESSKDAQKALGSGLPAGFLAMFLISVLLFGRVRQPLIIWLIVPMAAVGVVSGLLATDMPFGFMSLLGFLSLFGMLIKNAIVLIEEIDLQIQEGLEAKVAIITASASRLRPVALAAITTILGMAPLLSDAFFADMSVTIMGGLAFATILTMIAVPVFYSIFYKVSYRAK